MSRGTPNPDWTSLAEGLEAFSRRLDADYAERVAQHRQENARVPDSLMSSARRPTASVIPIGPSRTCRWVTTDGKPWGFCGEPSRLGYSYCTEHARRVWRIREDTDAA
jgi:hypothetical protein